MNQTLMEPKIWADKITLPTYEVGEPNKNPLFLEKRVYQGSSGKIYPLAFTDTLSDEKIDKAYDVVYLENAFLKIMIMPEMGGKIYRALDKTNNYDFVYYNQVVKPALVGLTGPWVSGGIEFNWPQHHRPTTFSTVEYVLVDNADGSKTCWVSEIDRMYGTKGSAGFTIYKDKAYLEVKGQLYNRTEVPQTFLWWANPAVKVNDYTKSIFPPDVHAVFDHGKRDVSKFPIATGEYYKIDYSAGVDISRYKNIPVPTSYMAYHSEYNFVGGYDYSEEAGILHIANHHISPGKKQWTWGCGDFGRAWDRNLTDEDGPYIELMTGVYTDNQPDFTWLAPKEVKTFTQYFMPYKGVGEVKNATLDIMLNLEFTMKEALIKLYTTSKHKELTLILQEDEKIVYKEVIEEITPLSACEFRVNLEDKLDEHHYIVRVMDVNGQELIDYSPKKMEVLETPDPATAPLDPEAIGSCEELFLIGQHLEQYRHATYSPEDYYLEALRRYPEDIRCNNAYGLLMYRRGQFKIAEEYIRKAVKASIKRNPNPYDSEPYYNLGLTLRKQNRLQEAYSAFYKATWSGAWQNSGFYEVASIDALRGDYSTALIHIEESIARNTRDIKARGLQSILLRHLERTDEAKCHAEQTLKIDKTSFVALFELFLLGERKVEDIVNLLRDNAHNYMELALDYSYGGFYSEAISVLDTYLSMDKTQDNYPMVYYLKGFLYSRTGDKERSIHNYELGSKAHPQYCFPHRLEELIFLEDVLIKCPEDGMAYYYLGNLYYDKKQYEKAIDLWKRSTELTPGFATHYRNLGLALVNINKDDHKGLECLEKAFSCDAADARVFFELDQLYKRMNDPLDKRLLLMEKYMHLVEQRDDLFVEYLTVLNQLGQYKKVMAKISSRIFHPWEGGEGKVIAQYKRSRIELAKASIDIMDYMTAIDYLNECKTYPSNLGEGKLINTLENDIDYFLGLAYEGLGDLENAKKHYRSATVGIDTPTDARFYNDQPADMMFYQGLAWRKLGNEDKALSEFNRMFDFGEKHIRDRVKIDYFAVSLPDFLVFDQDLQQKHQVHCQYLMALGLLGKGAYNKAVSLFNSCAQLDENHQGIYYHKRFRRAYINDVIVIE